MLTGVNLNLDFHLETSRPPFYTILKLVEKVSLAVLVKRIRFRGETPLWSHLTLRCLNPLHKTLYTCRKFVNLYSGPNTSEAILVSAAHCNYVCKVFLISLPAQISSLQDEADMSRLEICCCREPSSPASCRNVSKIAPSDQYLTHVPPILPDQFLLRFETNSARSHTI